MLKSQEHFSQHLCFLPGQSLRNKVVAGDRAEYSALNLPWSSSLTCLPCLKDSLSHHLLMKESFVFQSKICRPLFPLLISRAGYMVSQARTLCWLLLCTNVAPETWRTKAACSGFANQLLCSKDCLQRTKAIYCVSFQKVSPIQV